MKPHNFILETQNSMLRLYNVMRENLEASYVEAVFKQLLGQLAGEVEKFYGAINTESKFAKKRVRVDLIQMQKSVAWRGQVPETTPDLVFESRDTCEMFEHSIRSIIQSKCGLITNADQAAE